MAPSALTTPLDIARIEVEARRERAKFIAGLISALGATIARRLARRAPRPSRMV